MSQELSIRSDAHTPPSQPPTPPPAVQQQPPPAPTRPPPPPFKSKGFAFERFPDNTQYRTKVAVQHLFFDVSLYRAPLNDEAHKELLGRQVVAWGAKALSPEETLVNLRRFIDRRATMQGDVLTAAEEDDTMGSSAYKAVMETAGDTVEARIRNYVELGHRQLFTRPPVENFVDLAEETNVVEPPQPVTPLTIMELRSKQGSAIPSTKMYICLGLGTIHPPLSHTAVRVGGVSVVQEGPINDVPLNGMSWVGGEVVLCALDMVGENELHCKPRPGKEHVCHVDASYVYSFRMELCSTDPTEDLNVTASGGGTFRSAVLARTFANLLQETLRASRKLDSAVMRQTERDDAEKRQLLRQAIMNRMTRSQRSSSHGYDSAGGVIGRSPSGSRGVTPRGPHAVPLSARSRAQVTKTMSNGVVTSAVMPNGVVFTPFSPYEGHTRLHIMGHIETTKDVIADSLFVRYQFVLPDGCTEDSEINTLAGLNPNYATTPVTSQLTFASLIKDQDYNYKTRHVFNLPFELHVTMPVLSPSPVRLVMAFFSKGSGGSHHQSVAGYTQITIPVHSGHHEMEGLLWRPKLSAYEYLKSMFIGGAPQLADEREDVAIPAHVMNGYSSRLGLQTESTGSAQVNLMVISHSKAAASAQGADSSRGSRGWDTQSRRSHTE
jgi:hypothetical protein